MRVERHKIVITIMVDSCKLFGHDIPYYISLLNVINSCELFMTCNVIMIAVINAFTLVFTCNITLGCYFSN